MSDQYIKDLPTDVYVIAIETSDGGFLVSHYWSLRGFAKACLTSGDVTHPQFNAYSLTNGTQRPLDLSHLIADLQQQMWPGNGGGLTQPEIKAALKSLVPVLVERFETAIVVAASEAPN